MKKTSSRERSRNHEVDMLPEYRFDYGKARPNRFAARSKSASRQVILDPDVAAVFTTPESVNAVLRALIKMVPKRASAGRRSKA